jgi:aspartate kinase
MQSSAVSFVVCTDYQSHKIAKLLDFLQDEFSIKQENNVQLLTVLYYEENQLQDLVAKYQKFLEQKTAQYYRAVVGE